MCRPDQCTGGCAQQAACGNTPLDMGTGGTPQPPCALQEPGSAQRTLWLQAETGTPPVSPSAENAAPSGNS